MRAYNLHVLAEHLHKMVWELNAMPNRELMDWQAYFRIKQRNQKR